MLWFRVCFSVLLNHRVLENELKRFLAIFLILTFSNFSFADDASQERTVRFSVWAQREVYPGYFDSDNVSEKEKNLNKNLEGDGEFSVPVRKIKEIAPFLVQGMVYGWNFDYTPSDRARAVSEFFEFLPIRELSDPELSSINYAKPWAADDRLSAWVEFRRSEAQIQSYRSWTSVQHPRIKGVGYAPLSEGFEGIRKASEQALKNAVRNYERTKVKTKPKQITGRVLISEPPLIGIDSGRYKVTLDFFMESVKIIEYKTF